MTGAGQSLGTPPSQTPRSERSVARTRHAVLRMVIVLPLAAEFAAVGTVPAGTAAAAAGGRERPRVPAGPGRGLGLLRGGRAGAVRVRHADGPAGLPRPAGPTLRSR